MKKLSEIIEKYGKFLKAIESYSKVIENYRKLVKHFDEKLSKVLFYQVCVAYMIFGLLLRTAQEKQGKLLTQLSH